MLAFVLAFRISMSGSPDYLKYGMWYSRRGIWTSTLSTRICSPWYLQYMNQLYGELSCVLVVSVSLFTISSMLVFVTSNLYSLVPHLWRCWWVFCNLQVSSLLNWVGIWIYCYNSSLVSINMSYNSIYLLKNFKQAAMHNINWHLSDEK